MHKITETSSKFLPKPSVQLSIYNHVGLSSFSKFPPRPCLNHPCKNVKYVCMFKKNVLLYSVWILFFSMLVLAERLGSSQPLNTQIDFLTVSNKEEKRRPRILIVLVHSLHSCVYVLLERASTCIFHVKP